MTTRLHQIVAVHKRVASDAGGRFAELFRQVQKVDRLTGHERTNRPYNSETIPLPAEAKKVEFTAHEVINQVTDVMTRFWDLTATRDWADTKALADVKLQDGTVLISQAPVDFLLFLEHQFDELRKFIKAIPTLPLAEEWHAVGDGTWKTDEIETKQMQKTPHPFVKWAPPDSSYRQEAQVETYSTDDPVGTWRLVKFSGALHISEATEIMKRLDALIVAVKYAREEANSIEVENKRVATQLFEYLFAPVT